jgi:hypothetical protein
MESKDPWSGREYRSVSRHSRDAARTARSAQKRQSPVARGSDKVQLMSAVGPMQPAGHNKIHGTGSIVPAVATKARAGHPRFRNGEKKHEKPGQHHAATDFWHELSIRARPRVWQGMIPLRGNATSLLTILHRRFHSSAFIVKSGDTRPIPRREVCNPSERRTMATAASVVRGGMPRPHGFVHIN